MTFPPLTFVDFFAGSGLVTQGVRHACLPVWSNDVCPKKAAIYTANHGADHFHLGSIEQVKGAEIPQGQGSARHGNRTFSASNQRGQRPVI
jgi:site-specific DNA-cytosine methylase